MFLICTIKCQIAIVPTNSETFGHCIAEPLVLQRILITKHVGVAIDVVRHGENGFFFETKEDLVNCLKEIREMSLKNSTEFQKMRKQRVKCFGGKILLQGITMKCSRNYF
jgi:glycosyltransferase involved in cell wall biosynthesis